MKKVVEYDALTDKFIQVGHKALVLPISKDPAHPPIKYWVATEPVVKVYKNGRFDTSTTKYVPLGH